MKYELISRGSGNIIKDTLINRGVVDIPTYLNPHNKDDIDPFNFFAMDKAVNMLRKHINNKNNICILVDCDVDGFTSSTELYQYFKVNHPNINVSVVFHGDKLHGINQQILTELKKVGRVDLLIIPDASTNDREEVEQLSQQMDILIIDHHMPTQGKTVVNSDKVVLINNHLSLNINTNTELTGAGMVYKFLQAMGDCENIDNISQFAAIGQIGDNSDYCTNNQIRYLVFKGIKNIDNPLILEVTKDIRENKCKLAPVDLAFSIIPLINAVCRVGTMEEKKTLFNAMNKVDFDGDVIVEKRKLDRKTRKYFKTKVAMTKYELFAEELLKVKKRQKELQKKGSETMKVYGNEGAAIFIIQTAEEGSTTGLMAQQLAKSYGKPAIVLEEKDGVYKGSCRGDDKLVKSMKDWCNDTGLVVFAEGHDNAFGIAIDKNKLEEFKEKTKEIKQGNNIYQVDKIYTRILKDDIERIDDNRHLFGKKVEQPLLAFENISVKRGDIKLSKGGKLTIKANGVEFIKFNTSYEEYESLVEGFDFYINFNFVGTGKVGYFLGRRSLEVVITDYEKILDNDEYDWESAIF